jgi:hypothetical protein
MTSAMRRMWLAFFVASAIGSIARAQTAVTIDDLTAPSSPAFVLLDASPASVARPETPKAFTLNLLNALASTTGLPQDYAVEVAPYWMASHPTLTFHQYQQPNVWRSIAQTFSVSLATVPMTSEAPEADTAGTRLGIGVRTSVVNGRPNPRLEHLVDALHDVDDEILDAVNAGRSVDPELRAKALEAAAAVQAADAERIGFFVALAAAQSWDVPNDDVDRRQVDRRAFWVTPSYRFRPCSDTAHCGSAFDLIGVVRWLHDRNVRFWDYGGRFVWRPTRQFNISLESLGRAHAGTAPPPAEAAPPHANTRTVGTLEYRINQDLVLYGSVGRDFAHDASIRPLVSILGFNIGLGSKASVKADASRR